MLSYSLLVPSNVCMGLIEVCVCVCVYEGSFPNKQSYQWGRWWSVSFQK